MGNTAGENKQIKHHKSQAEYDRTGLGQLSNGKVLWDSSIRSMAPPDICYG